MNIVDKVKRLKSKHKSSDPFDICNQLNIEVVFTDIGSLKGMYTCIKRNRFIVIHQNLNIHTKRVVCAHELAHDQLHRKISLSAWLKDSDFNINSSKFEYEANVFAAELLLDEETLIGLILDGKSISEISSLMYTDSNLIAIKLISLMKNGYKFALQDYDSCFLKSTNVF